MSDLIERQAAIEVAKQHWYKPDIAGALAELPSAQPETHEKRTEMHGVCLDTISRQAAIDALEREKTYCRAFREGYAPVDVFEKYNAGLTDGIKAISSLPSAQPKPQWIPWDSGRLPDDSGTYIVTAYDGVQERVTFAKYQKRLKRWELTGARAYWRVLAWMPLPEPYRKDGD